MANEEKTTQQVAEEVINFKVTKGQLFQLHLCVVCRSAVATAKWTNATSEQEQTALQGEIQYLSELTSLINGVLKNGQN